MESESSWICHVCENQVLAIDSLEERIAALTVMKNDVQ